MLRQRTIRKAVHAIGIGVHSGEKVRVTLRPAEVNTGIRFYRSDLGSGEPVFASQLHSDSVHSKFRPLDRATSRVE